jgi:hypothetical protein
MVGLAALLCLGGFVVGLWIVFDDGSPAIELVTPAEGSFTNDSMLQFTGRAFESTPDVQLRIYRGVRVRGRPLRVQVGRVHASGDFSIALQTPLRPGTYTAVVLQRTDNGATPKSAPSTFVFWPVSTTRPSAASVVGMFRGNPRLGDNPAPGGHGAISFDGTDDDLLVFDAPPLDATQGATVQVRLNPGRRHVWQNVVGKPGEGPAAAQNYALWLNPDGRAVALFGGDSRASARVDSPVLVPGWHDVTATYDGRVAKMYLDGTLVSSRSKTVRLLSNAYPLMIAAGSDGSRRYAGALDGFTIYPRALSAARIRAEIGNLSAFDSTEPVLTLTTPEPGSATTDATPDLAGMAGLAAGDSTRVSIHLYPGADTSGEPLRTVSSRRLMSGTWGASLPAALPRGTYTASAEQSDKAGNVARATTTFTVSRRRAQGPQVVAVGDIAYCDDNGDEKTAALVDGLAGPILTLGDHAYEYGTANEFAACYDASWGRHRHRTVPTIGGHEYGDGRDPQARAYYEYFSRQLAPFGAAASDPRRGWYSHDIGTWHVVHLNTTWREVGLPKPGSEQLRWLGADLERHSNLCTLAIWHDPVFSSGRNGGGAGFRPLWDVLYASNADLVLNGHDHDYERFAPQAPSGAYDPGRGIREIVVGTGGRSHYDFASGRGILPNSEVRNDRTFGVLTLRLGRAGYDWKFVPEAGKRFSDSGSDTCH